MNNFPERLKKLRTSKNLTEKDVANMIGISLNTYKKYENGKTLPSINTFIYISNLFNISNDYLAGLSDTP